MAFRPEVEQFQHMNHVAGWRGLAARIRNSRFVRGVMVLAGGTALGQVISVAASPLITRLYDPEAFGILSVYASLLSIISIVAALRYEYAIPLPEDELTATELLFLSLITVIAVSSIVAIAVWLGGDGISALMGTPELQPFLWLLPVGVFIAGLNQVLTYWTIRHRDYARLARRTIGRSAGGVAVQSGLGFLGVGALGLLLGELIGRAGGSANLGIAAWQRVRHEVHGLTVRGIRRAARSYIRFPLLSSGSSLLNSAGIFLPPVLITSGYGLHVSGLFALANRMLEVPIRLVGTSVANVYLAEAAGLLRSDPARLRRMFHRTALRLLVIGGIPAITAGLVSPWIFAIVFGEDWRDAGAYAQVLAPYIAARFVVLPISQTLNILNRQDIQLLWDAGRLVVVVVSLLGAARLGWPPRLAIFVFGIGMLLCYLTLFLLAARALSRFEPLAVGVQAQGSDQPAAVG